MCWRMTLTVTIVSGVRDAGRHEGGATSRVPSATAGIAGGADVTTDYVLDLEGGLPGLKRNGLSGRAPSP